MDEIVTIKLDFISAFAFLDLLLLPFSAEKNKLLFEAQRGPSGKL